MWIGVFASVIVRSAFKATIAPSVDSSNSWSLDTVRQSHALWSTTGMNITLDVALLRVEQGWQTNLYSWELGNAVIEKDRMVRAKRSSPIPSERYSVPL